MLDTMTAIKEEDEDIGLRFMNNYGSDNDEENEIFKLVKDPTLSNKKGDGYKCSLCKYKSDTQTHLRNHYKTHLPPYVEKYTCQLCKHTFKSNKELVEHKKEHENEGWTFLCKICKIAFTEHCDWLLHEIKHLSRLLYKCRECGRHFALKSIYETHIHTHYNLNLCCKVCNETFHNRIIFDSHMNLHNGKYNCCECGKAYRDKSTLDYHMMSHTGVRKHQCLYCGKGFGNSSQVVIHTRTHTNERPYECEHCRQRFKQYTDSVRHKCKNKPKEKKFQCDICKRSFLRKESIITHLKIHTNDRQYKCQHCDHGSITSSALKWHIFHKHSNVQDIFCDVEGCNYKSKYRKHMPRHMRTVHNIYV